MQKYTAYQKLKSTPYCSYFTAQNKLTHQSVTIKKLKTKKKWEDLLKSPEVIFMKQSNYRFTPKIIQIIKLNNKFFIIYEELQQNLQQFINRLQEKEVIKIASQIMNILQTLSKHNIPFSHIKTQFFFYNNKTLKIAHIPIAQSNQDIFTHVLQPDYRYFPPEKLKHKKQDQKSLIFEVGCIMSQLLLGNSLIKANNKLEYVSAMNQLFPKQQIDSIFINSNKFDHLNSYDSRLKMVCIQKDITSLLNDMLRINENERISFQQTLFRIKHIDNKLNQTSFENRSKSQALDRKKKFSQFNNSTEKKLSPKCDTKYLINYRFATEMYQTIQEVSPHLNKQQNTQDFKYKCKMKKRPQFLIPAIQSCRISRKPRNGINKLMIKKSKLTYYAQEKRQSSPNKLWLVTKCSYE